MSKLFSIFIDNILNVASARIIFIYMQEDTIVVEFGFDIRGTGDKFFAAHTLEKYKISLLETFKKCRMHLCKITCVAYVIILVFFKLCCIFSFLSRIFLCFISLNIAFKYIMQALCTRF